MLYTCSYNIDVKFKDDKRPKIPNMDKNEA